MSPRFILLFFENFANHFIFFFLSLSCSLRRQQPEAVRGTHRPVRHSFALFCKSCHQQLSFQSQQPMVGAADQSLYFFQWYLSAGQSTLSFGGFESFFWCVSTVIVSNWPCVTVVWVIPKRLSSISLVWVNQIEWNRQILSNCPKFFKSQISPIYCLYYCPLCVVIVFSPSCLIIIFFDFYFYLTICYILTE